MMIRSEASSASNLCSHSNVTLPQNESLYGICRGSSSSSNEATVPAGENDKPDTDSREGPSCAAVGRVRRGWGEGCWIGPLTNPAVDCGCVCDDTHHLQQPTELRQTGGSCHLFRWMKPRPLLWRNESVMFCVCSGSEEEDHRKSSGFQTQHQDQQRS